jgi:RND family efflux transporter MFP subunit
MRPYRGSYYALMIVAAIGGCGADEKSQHAAPPPPDVIVSGVVTRDVADTGEYTGRTDALDTVDIRARVTGYLTEIHFADGQEVNKGDLLFQIDPRPFDASLQNAEGQKAQWVAKLARAKADVQRYEKLVPTGAATPQDLDKAKADMGEATAAIQSADASIERARLDLEFAGIRSPMTGQISRSMFSKGNLIRADNDVLTTIVAIDPIVVYFNVDERALLQSRERARASLPPTASLPDIRSLQIPVFVGLANEQGYPHRGTIDFADNRVDPTTGTIRVQAKLDNSRRVFKPGLFARIRVSASEAAPALLVTDRAVATDQSQKFVYVVDDKNVAQYRPVKLGRLEDDGLRVITAGLQPNDRVIVAGLQRARPGKPVTPQLVDMPRAGVKASSRPAAEAGGKDAGAQATKAGRH